MQVIIDFFFIHHPFFTMVIISLLALALADRISRKG
jgi:hypothetical protein